MFYYYTGRVYNVVDGDTIDVEIDLGFKVSIRQRLRLNGLNTPEKGNPGFKEAKDWLTNKILNQIIMIKTSKISKFGYYLAEVWLGSTSINESLIDQRLAQIYHGERKGNES